MTHSKASKKDKPYGGSIDLTRLFGSNTEELAPTEPSELKNFLPLAQIHRKPEQVRRYFDPQKMEQLTASVREYGILENLLVRSMPGKPREYELIAGERRYRAAQGAGLTEVPATILELSDQQALQITLVENLQREDLNPVEETEGILQLLAIRLELSVQEVVSLLYRMQNESTRNLNHNVVVQEEEVIEEVFNALGRMSWQSFVKHRLPLRNLPEEVLEALQQGKIEYTKAQTIGRVKDEGQRQELLQAAIAQDLSIRDIRDRIKQLSQSQNAIAQPSDYLKRFNAVSRQLKKTNAWEDHEKRDRLETLLKEIEDLVK
ncbi:ParB/RepB/Spo0J family partition protein (plasmid) [Leptolyngbya sp. NK1-12]|jgi:ParB family transcriptional regulator, chromosome partitioning protein|uniref:ParB/RepB/Spo0J family partition protein n=1 Tax=Leptolyngbya sp. NK1-12 TaxID=2547451 RepID=A0AA96WLQ9_9CYAN|nr:ParB/RepB/Spo0J family partition protein [Leptolyngbya sp. NK1-12]WNZ28147.1 ParB/RepB/Spo0J family partition protein [Leptolyngbya sp. NK1-12]